MLTDSRSNPNDVLIALDDNLTLVAGGTSGTAIAPVTDQERRTALRRLAHIYSGFDTIVIDTRNDYEVRIGSFAGDAVRFW